MTVPNRSRMRYTPGLCGNAFNFLRMESLIGTKGISRKGAQAQRNFQLLQAHRFLGSVSIGVD